MVAEVVPHGHPGRVGARQEHPLPIVSEVLASNAQHSTWKEIFFRQLFFFVNKSRSNKYLFSKSASK
jgi:hypothetical protein